MTIEVLAPDVREIWTFDMMLAPANGGHGAPPLARVGNRRFHPRPHETPWRTP
jgi:hypothetical protein